VGAAGGFLVQMLSGAASEVAELIERNVAGLPQITSLIQRGDGPREILAAVLAGLDVKFIAEEPVRFACPCTRERVFGALLLLGPADIEEMIAQEGQAEVQCEFCAERYVVGRDELTMLVQETQGTA